jgi:chromosome segregation ATPase
MNDKKDDVKQYDDPLMGPVNKNKGGPNRSNGTGSSERSKTWGVVATVVLVLILGALGYSLLQSQERLEELSLRLETSQQKLGDVSENLQTSQGAIVGLQKVLKESQSQLGAQGNELGRYKELYSDIRSDQAEQSEKLQAIEVRKADQEAVNELQQTTAGLRTGLGEVQTGLGDVSGRLSETSGQVGQLRDVADSNRKGIAENRGNLGNLRTTVDANSSDITGVKKSLDRDYYNFELQKKGSSMQIRNVSLRLRNTNFKHQRYHVEIIFSGKRMNKKKVNINEPIYFYVKGSRKPYEVLVNRVDKKFVVGFLSIPKT